LKEKKRKEKEEEQQQQQQRQLLTHLFKVHFIFMLTLGYV